MLSQNQLKSMLPMPLDDNFYALYDIKLCSLGLLNENFKNKIEQTRPFKWKLLRTRLNKLVEFETSAQSLH